MLSSHNDEHSSYSEFTSRLTSCWDVEDEGEVSDLLNIEIAREGRHVVLRQRGYIEKLMQAFCPDGVPPSFQKNKAPCSKDIGQLVADALVGELCTDRDLLREYQSLVGALLYCSTQTRPDVAYAVGMLSRAMGRPTPELLKEGKRVLHYLYLHRDVGLRYVADDFTPLYGMTDSDWAVKHSTSGYVFKLSGAIVSWASKKQVSVALSSAEAEIVAASEASKEALALRMFLADLGVHDGKPTSLASDNQAAIATAYNPEHHSRMKHVERRHFFVRECVENLQIVVPYVPTCDNLADFFTKALEPKTFFAMRDKLMNVAH